MADLPLEEAKQPLVKEGANRTIKVTLENAPLLLVHYMAQIHERLGHVIKLLEEKK